MTAGKMDEDHIKPIQPAITLLENNVYLNGGTEILIGHRIA